MREWVALAIDCTRFLCKSLRRPVNCVPHFPLYGVGSGNGGDLALATSSGGWSSALQRGETTPSKDTNAAGSIMDAPSGHGQALALAHTCTLICTITQCPLMYITYQVM